MDVELYLSELTRIVKAFAPRSARILDRRKLASSNLGWAAIYRGMVAGSIVTERSGKKALEAQGGSVSSYYTQRSLLKTRLLNTLFVLDLEQRDTSPVLKGKYQCNRKRFLASTMLLFGMRRFAIPLVKNALELAKEYQLTQMRLELTGILREHASLIGSTREYEKYRSAFRDLLEAYVAEARAAEMYEKVNLLFARSSAEKPQLAPRFEDAADYVTSLAHKHGTFELDLTSHRLSIAAAQIALDYETTLRRCDQAFGALSSRWPVLFDKFKVGEINLMRLTCAAHLRDLELATRLRSECEQIYQPGSNNWFVLQENYMQALLHKYQFATGGEVLGSVVSNDRMGIQPIHVQARWKLFEIFLKFADAADDKSSVDASLSEELHSLEADKKGFKVCLIVLRVLGLLRQDRFDEIEHLLEPLRAYRQRHFKKKDKSPGSAMLDLILLASEHDYGYEATASRMGDTPQLLKGRLPYLERPDGFLMLPFDWIWDQMLTSMRLHEQD